MKKIMTLMLSCLMILGMVACKTVGSVPTAGPFDARESVASDSRVSSVATLNPDIDKALTCEARLGRQLRKKQCAYDHV